MSDHFDEALNKLEPEIVQATVAEIAEAVNDDQKIIMKQPEGIAREVLAAESWDNIKTFFLEELGHCREMIRMLMAVRVVVDEDEGELVTRLEEIGRRSIDYIRKLQQELVAHSTWMHDRGLTAMTDGQHIEWIRQGNELLADLKEKVDA